MQRDNSRNAPSWSEGFEDRGGGDLLGASLRRRAFWARSM